MNDKVHVLFWLYTAKMDGTGKAPVYMRLTCCGERAQISLGLKIEAKNWKADPGRARGKSDEARLINLLKKLAKTRGISKRLTFHMARHTFATTVTLSNGVSIESVSKMLGHTDIKTTQIYSKVMEDKIGREMERLI